MKTKLLALALLAGGSMFAETRFSIGIHVGGYNPGYYVPAPPPYLDVRPPCPGPDYSWTDSHWGPQGPGRTTWVEGYWTRQPSFGSYHATPDYERPSYDDRYNDTYGRQGYTRGFEQNRSRGFNQDRYQHRGIDRDDRDNDRSRRNAYGNGFRNR